MMVGGGGFCVSEGEAGVGKSYGRARRGCEARQGSGQSCRVRSLAEIDRAPCSLHVVVPSARRRRGGGKIERFDNS